MGKVRLNVKGFNQMRFLSILAEKEIPAYKLERKNAGEMCFTIRAKDEKKTFAILDKMCYTYTVLSRSDFKFAVATIATRLGLVFGLVGFTAVLVLFYGFIWRIDISGNEKVDDLTIERALNSAGISIGKPLKNIDKNAVRNLVNSIDGILETSVEISGTMLKLEVVETTDYLEPSKDSYADIVSAFDGRITKIIATSGTVEAKIGSLVKKGDVLIGAYRLDAEQNKIIAAAKGEVYGNVAFTKTIDFTTLECGFARTGKKYVCTDLSIFGLSIPSGKEHGFENFEYETSHFDAFENFFAPLKTVRTVFYETEYYEKVYDVNLLLQHYKDKIIEENIIKAGGEEIKASHHLAALSENVYRLSVYIEAQMKISG